MTDAHEMSTPVTRGELREEIALLHQKFDQKFAVFEQKLEHRIERYEQGLRRDLELWGGALLARIEASDRRVERFEQRLLAELARHVGAIQEALAAQLAVVDEKYADLPGRVARLEASAPQR